MPKHAFFWQGQKDLKCFAPRFAVPSFVCGDKSPCQTSTAAPSNPRFIRHRRRSAFSPGTYRASGSNPTRIKKAPNAKALNTFFGRGRRISFLRKSRLTALTVRRTVIHYRSLQILLFVISKRNTATCRQPHFFLAGAEGFEPSARGFGDHCSTN